MKRYARIAKPGDRDMLVKMMEEFYAESESPFDADQAAEAFENLLRDDSVGRVWLLEREGTAAGYVVLTVGFSMEFGGRDAFVDDLFVREEHRRYGLGRVAMKAVLDECKKRRVRALHLEVARENSAAKALYRRFGFVDHGRQLMTANLKKNDLVV
ncbi:MAG: GNAT family N-acetyltransferase [Candidatus Latescibacterota bacterium]|nr:MAG: GNAT family N-acetyltransferase [Candidatus Latescibacterota bacterium]